MKPAAPPGPMRSGPITVLMYHGIGDAQGDAASADPHYTVGESSFRAQIAAIRAAGRQACSVARCAGRRDDRGGPIAREDDDDSRPVGITFDDGLASNARAADFLAGQGASADFFINPPTIGTPGFLDWPTLRRMAASGMSIQSHGMTHRYLDELDPATVLAELADSRKAIEDGIGMPVTIYAPAGGRMPPGFLERAAEAGYRIVCSSRVALWRPEQGPGRSIEVPRFAVLAGTSTERVRQWVTQAPLEVLRQTTRYRVLRASKKLLGNRGHERLRALLGVGQVRPGA